MIGSFFVAKIILRGDYFVCIPKLYTAEELANAIIIKAVEDYRKAMKDLWLYPRSVNARHTIVECESFFKSPYFNTLTSVDGVWLIYKLKQEFETKTRKELEKCISPMIKNCRDLSVR